MMENQIETSEAQGQDETESELYASAGYFVRTDLRIGGAGCPVSQVSVFIGDHPKCVTKTPC